MADNDIIKILERMREEDPDGLSSDVFNYINQQKSEIESLELEIMTLKDKSSIECLLGVIEGVAVTFDEKYANPICEAVEAIDEILNKGAYNGQ